SQWIPLSKEVWFFYNDNEIAILIIIVFPKMLTLLLPQYPAITTSQFYTLSFITSGHKVFYLLYINFM
ncbi:MAG: hypothetical protein ACYC0D_09565, partial [Candidatus Humimicrobiaceae bacterium]